MLNIQGGVLFKNYKTCMYCIARAVCFMRGPASCFASQVTHVEVGPLSPDAALELVASCVQGAVLPDEVLNTRGVRE